MPQRNCTVGIWDTLEFDGFSRLPLLDGHVHVWPGLEPSILWEILGRSGAPRCNALSITRLEDGTLNQEALRVKAASGGRAYAFGALDYSAHFRGSGLASDDLVEQADRLQRQGFDGIKMAEGKTAVYARLPDRFNGPLFRPLFAWMEAQRVPLLMHVADPARFWDPARAAIERWSYAQGDFPIRQEQYAELEQVLVRHPRLTVILAHLLFLWDELPQAARFLEAHPSVAFDLTPGVEGYFLLSQDPEAAREFILCYQDRLIYGTDIGAESLLTPSQLVHPARESASAWLVRAFLETDWDFPVPSGMGDVLDLFAGQRLRGVALPIPVLEKIYFRNFERMVGAFPRPLL